MNIITSLPDTTSFDMGRFWKLESKGINQKPTETDERSILEEYQEKNVSFKDKHYVAKLPWTKEKTSLPTNINIAKRRTESTMSRLFKDKHLLKRYEDIIAEQERSGFIETVGKSSSSSIIHYIPHHGVMKESKTTQIRIVFDCSCRMTSEHLSLNDCLSSEPPNLNDLTNIILRLRRHPVAVSTDIEKAFLHVRLAEENRDVVVKQPRRSNQLAHNIPLQGSSLWCEVLTLYVERNAS